jgi:hypothetical protein
MGKVALEVHWVNAVEETKHIGKVTYDGMPADFAVSEQFRRAEKAIASSLSLLGRAWPCC